MMMMTMTMMMMTMTMMMIMMMNKLPTAAEIAEASAAPGKAEQEPSAA